MSKGSDKFKWSEFPGFFTSKIFQFTLIRIGILFIILWLLHGFILDFYTNHGQKLKLPNYENILFGNALKHAQSKGYDLVVTDSLFLLNKPGGIILSQVPKPNSIVKRGRTIYVTTSRFGFETITSSSLPDLYGQKFDYSRVELANSFEINSKIIGTKFDPGQEGHILEVYYKGKLLFSDQINEKQVLINKGDTLEFILSNRKSGEISVPDVECKTLTEAKFILAASKLNPGKIIFDGTIDDEELVYVLKQIPHKDSVIEIGGEVHLELSLDKPEKCP